MRAIKKGPKPLRSIVPLDFKLSTQRLYHFGIEAERLWICFQESGDPLVDGFDWLVGFSTHNLRRSVDCEIEVV